MSTPCLLVTANVGSIFEDPAQMLKLWTEEFLSTVARLDPKFIALHCQEVGGKNYENSMRHVEQFVKLLMSSNELRLFDKIRVFLDEDYSSAENFTALGNLYFVHQTVSDCLLWDFKEMKFVRVEDKQTHCGNIEAVTSKEKAKFPQDFFPECKWSRKGFMRTRWSLNGTIFDLVNIHLFHDASNFVAMQQFPSVYCKNRRRALEHTLQRFHNDVYGNVPLFVFGDFNFRTDTEAVINKLTEGLTTTKQNQKNEIARLQFENQKSELVLTVGKKEFNHLDHQRIFFGPSSSWLKSFDKELEAFQSYLTEFPVNFPPSYPFEEKISHAKNYMQTRCPAWCDRVLLSNTARQLIVIDGKLEYGLMGMETCMGDHKPVFLRTDLKTDSGTVDCCKHQKARECLPNPKKCECCKTFASVEINIVDMSDLLQQTNTQLSTTVDCKLLQEPITRDMLTHEPYTPESSDSHSPKEPKPKRDTVSPEQLKTRLEDILNDSPKLMKRSVSANNLANIEHFTVVSSTRNRTMSELPTNRDRLMPKSTISRLESHHSSSDEDWFEFDNNNSDSSINRKDENQLRKSDWLEFDANSRELLDETVFEARLDKKKRQKCCCIA